MGVVAGGLALPWWSFAQDLPECKQVEEVDIPSQKIDEALADVSKALGDREIGSSVLIPGNAENLLTKQSCTTLLNKWENIFSPKNKIAHWSDAMAKYFDSKFPNGRTRSWAGQNLGITFSVCRDKVSSELPTCNGWWKTGKLSPVDPDEEDNQDDNQDQGGDIIPVENPKVTIHIPDTLKYSELKVNLYKGGLNPTKTSCQKDGGALPFENYTNVWHYKDLEYTKYCTEVSAKGLAPHIEEFELIGTDEMWIHIALAPWVNVKFELPEGGIEEQLTLLPVEKADSDPYGSLSQIVPQIIKKWKLQYQIGWWEYIIKLGDKEFLLKAISEESIGLFDKKLRQLINNVDKWADGVFTVSLYNPSEPQRVKVALHVGEGKLCTKEQEDVSVNNNEMTVVDTIKINGDGQNALAVYGCRVWYEFLGWGVKENDTNWNSLTTLKALNKKEVDLYAQWKKNSDLVWKTDYDPSKSTNEEIKKYYQTRGGTPFVDVKEGMKLDGEHPAKYQHLMFLYEVKNLENAQKVGYEVRLNDAQGDVIAYGKRDEVKAVDGYYWSFRDWRADPQFKAEDIANYAGGPAGLALVESRNDDILKAGTKVVFIVKVKYADREERIEYPYTITLQDVINATIGDKVKVALNDGDVQLNQYSVLKGSKLAIPASVEKAKYTFQYWALDKEGKQKFVVDTLADKDIVLYAQWKRKSTSSSSSGGGSSSRGGSSSSSSTSSKTSTSSATTGTNLVATGSALISGEVKKSEVDVVSVKSLDEMYANQKVLSANDSARAKALEVMHDSLKAESNKELRDAYLYAYLRGITTQPTLKQAELNRGLTRAEMAKMMSVFATKVLGKKSVKQDVAHYADLAQVDGDLPNYIQLAYTLEIMGVDDQGKALTNFEPNKYVSRAEFAAVLSRVLYGNKYNQKGENWAYKHLQALKDASILKDATPTIKEMRGWVMLMLMRSEGVK